MQQASRNTQRLTARAIALALPCALALASPACRSERPSDPRNVGERPNVLLLTVDTLRADHLGAYGYGLPTSAAIDGFARSGLTVTRCISAAPETAPAVASLLTGTYQNRHGVLRNRMILPDRATTLAEYFRRAGYETAGFVGNTLLADKFGFDQGLDHFAVFAPRRGLGHSDDFGATLASEWIAGGHDRPWFAWLHFMDPHGPWWPTPPVWSEDFDYPPGAFGTDPELEIAKSNFGLGVIPAYQKIPGMKRLSQYVPRYDGEIRYTDAQVRAVLGQLALSGLLENTLVVVTADHGESLTEHLEYLQHGWFVYDTTVRVPLIFSWSGRLEAGRTVDAQVSSVDVAATILDLAGVAHGKDLLDGRSFASQLRGGPADRSHAAYSVGPRENMPFAVSRDGWKLIHTAAGTPDKPNLTTPDDGFDTRERYELYDLAEDPSETTDLVDVEVTRVRDLKLLLQTFEASFDELRTAD